MVRLHATVPSVDFGTGKSRGTSFCPQSLDELGDSEPQIKQPFAPCLLVNTTFPSYLMLDSYEVRLFAFENWNFVF
jgi:hypothetical protein